jgi:hypothetical protein
MILLKTGSPPARAACINRAQLCYHADGENLTTLAEHHKQGATPMTRKLLLGLMISLMLAATVASAEPLADAVRAIEAGKHKEGAQMLKPLADAGNQDAQYRLGMLYYYGKGVKEDEKQAIELWKKAAAQGNVDSMFQIGSAFLFGAQTAKLVDDPDREAAMWYFQAASAGHAEAQYHLGLLFLAGKGVIEDRQQATYWMQQAAAQGHAEAKKAVGSIGAARK